MRYYFILLALLPLASFSKGENTNSFFDPRDSFIKKHPTCIMRIKKGDKNFKYLQKELSLLLKTRGYRPQFLVDEKQLLSGESYTLLSATFPKGKLWRDCIISMKIKVAAGNIINSSDESIFSKESKRSLPRVTFEGKERCKRALRDLFIHIPYCKKTVR